ncbi:MAG: carbohydrate-binding domain-containing protein [Niabella sp.]
MKQLLIKKENNYLNVILFAITIVLVLLITACSKGDVTSNSTTDTDSTGTGGTNTGSTSGSTIAISDVSTVTTGAVGNTDSAANADDLLANSTFGSTVSLVFNGNSATVSNPLTTVSVITNNDTSFIINATAEGVEYVLSGTSSKTVKIYSTKKFKLTLNGVSITSTNGPAINIQSSKRVFVVLADGTTNSLTDNATYTAYNNGTEEEDMKAALFSEGQLIFSGNGTLNVKGNYKHGIASDDYVRVISGTINITGAVTDGVHTNDAFIADGGTVSITAGSDAIECEEGYVVINGGTYTLNAGDDGIAASWETDATIDPYVTINGGIITVNSTGGEGIESKSTLTINGGNITLNTKDDCINAIKYLYINGGNIYGVATNNDAIDANGPVTITGGKIVVVGANSPEASFDTDRKTFKITGGIIVGIGGGAASPTASVSTQPSVRLGSTTANQIFHIESSDGAEALTFLVPKSTSTMLFTSPKLKSGTQYVIYTGGSVANGTSFNGLYTSGTYTKGTKSSTSFTTSTMFTMVGGSEAP